MTQGESVATICGVLEAAAVPAASILIASAGQASAQSPQPSHRFSKRPGEHLWGRAGAALGAGGGRANRQERARGGGERKNIEVHRIGCSSALAGSRREVAEAGPDQQWHKATMPPGKGLEWRVSGALARGLFG